MNDRTAHKLRVFAFWLVITAVGVVTFLTVLRIISPSQQVGYSIASMFLIGLTARIVRSQTLSRQ